MDLIRLNNHTALYRGDIKNASSSKLKLKAYNDRSALAYMRSPPSIYNITNRQTRPPQNYHDPPRRHRKPNFLVPETGNTRYLSGTAQYKQEIQRKITDLSRML